MLPDYYSILGVGVRATGDEIRAAYKRLARKHHPDMNQGSAVHEEKFKQILEAYQTLSDPEKRGRYDVRLLYQTMRPSGTPPGQPDTVYRGTPRTRREREREEYERRRPEREAYREKTGPPPDTRWSLHTVALTLMVLGTVVMGFLWFGDFMNRHTARTHLERGDFQTALEFDPELADAYFARYTYLKSRNAPVRFLLADLNDAIRFADEPRAGWYQERGQLYMRLDSGDRSLADFQRVREMKPKWDTAYLNLASFFSVQDPQPAKALRYFDSTLFLNPGNRVALFGRAQKLQELKSWEKSRVAWDAFIQLEPNERESRLARGKVWVELGQFPEACLDFDLALTMGASEALVWMQKHCASQVSSSEPQ